MDGMDVINIPAMIGWIITGLISVLITLIWSIYTSFHKDQKLYNTRLLDMVSKMNTTITQLQTMQTMFIEEMADFKSEQDKMWKKLGIHTEKIAKLEK